MRRASLLPMSQAMFFVFQINSAGRDAQSVQGLRRFLRNKLLDAGLTADVVSTSSDEFVVASASEERLKMEAEALSKLERDTAFFFSRTDYGVESSRDGLVAPTTREKEQLLRSILNSIKITHDDMSALRWQGVDPDSLTVGDALFVSLFVHSNVFTNAFPLHDDEGRAILKSQVFGRHLPSPSVVRTYCGSKTALFVALVQTLHVWLAALAVAATVAEYFIQHEGVSSKWVLLYSCVVPIWSALFLKHWRRKDAALVFEWEFHKLKGDTHALRWYLRGEQRMFQATGKSPIFSLSTTIKRHLILSVPLVVGLLLPSTVLLLINLNLDNTLSPSSPWYWPRVVAFGREYLSLDSAVLRVLSSGLQAAVLYFVNRIYAKYSYSLTRWEGWSTEEEFSSSFALKRIPFELSTTFLRPLCRALWAAPSVQRQELIGLMLGDFASRMFTELVWPVIYARYLSHYSIPRHSSAAAAQKETAVVPMSPFARKVLTEAEMPKMELFDYHCVMIRYYVIATCFASVFPLGAVITAALTYFEPKICLYSLIYFRQRGPSLRGTSVGIWLDRFVSAFGITCNTVLQAYTTGQLRASFADNAIVVATGTFGLAFLIEQVLRLIGWLISVLVPDVPPRVRESSKAKEKREMAKRRWADIHCQKQPGTMQPPDRAATPDRTADTLPSLNG